MIYKVDSYKMPFYMLNMGKCQQFHIEQPNNKYNNKNLQSSHSGRASHT